MDDIVICSGRDKAIVAPLSDKGETWIREHMSIKDGRVAITIDVEAVDEITKLIEADELIVRVK